MNGLYVLALLLTADPAKAEQCFVSGLEDCVGANRVFKEWTRSWARRVIIQNAIRMMKPGPEYTGPWAVPAPTVDAGWTFDRTLPLAALLGLKTFERFVFVMSVLERYSDQDCKALLGGSRHDLVRARNQAFKGIAVFSDAEVPGVAFDSGRHLLRQRWVAKTA
jgi:hypothetical protein